MSVLVSRRGFLQSAATAVSVASLADNALADDTSIGNKVYKSLKWDMIQSGGSVLDKFRLLKTLGYDGVELNSPDDVDKKEALAASRECELPIEGIVNATHWRIRHSDPDAAVREQAIANMETALRDAKLVGADSVLLVPGKVTDPETENHDHVWQRSISDIRSLLPTAESLQVRILIENVGNGFCTDPQLMADYIDEIDSPWVGVHFDIGNHISFSPPAEWIRILGHRIRKIDVKDRKKGQRPLVPIGDGDASWSDVRQALSDIGFHGWAAAEVRGGDRQRLTEILSRMDRVLGKSDGKPAERMPGATIAG